MPAITTTSRPEGHRLPHDPLNAIVGPRPIGWISSQGQNGIVNLAPYSFFNAFNYEPPIIGFSSVGPKDTLRNVQETGEFVWEPGDSQDCGLNERQQRLGSLRIRRVPAGRIDTAPLAHGCTAARG